jgi:hypothetical protein
MKRFRLIEERSTQVGLTPEQAEADRLDYIAAIRQVVRQPLNPAAGVQLEEMERGLRVLKALDGKRLWDVLELEDADHQHLCEKVRNARWPVVDERLVRFSHTILNATESVLDDTTPSPTSAGNRADALAVHADDLAAVHADGDAAPRSFPYGPSGWVVGQPRSVRPRSESGPG